MKVPDQWKCLTGTLPTAGKQDCGYTKADVIDMLRYIGAPPGLKGLISVARSLQEVLSALDRLLEERSKFYSELWRHICHDILSLQNIVEKRIPSVYVAGDKRKIRGPHMQHPLYGLLWHRAKLDQYQRQFSVLQAIAVYWFVKISRNHQGHGLVYNWLRYIRVLSEESPLTNAILPLLPTEPASLQGYYRSLVEIIDKSDDLDVEAVKHIQVLCRLVKSAIEEDVPSPRTASGRSATGGGGGPTRGDMPDNWRQVLAEYEIELDGQDLLVAHFLDDPEGFVAPDREPGLAPGEVSPGRESILVKTPRGDSGCYTLAEYAHKLRYAREALSLENQQLVTRWSVIREYEESALLASLSGSGKPPARLKPDTRLLLGLMLAIGRRLSEMVPENPAKPADEKDDSAITYKQSNRTLCLPTLQDLPRPRWREDQKGALRAFTRILHFHVPLRLASLFGPCYPRRTRGPVRIGDLFRRGRSEYQSEIDAFLGEINKKYGTRLTRRRVESWLFERIARLPGAGRCEAAAITGQVPHVLKNALHYFWVPERRLQEIHHRAIRPLVRWIR